MKINTAEVHERTTVLSSAFSANSTPYTTSQSACTADAVMEVAAVKMDTQVESMHKEMDDDAIIIDIVRVNVALNTLHLYSQSLIKLTGRAT